MSGCPGNRPARVLATFPADPATPHLRPRGAGGGCDAAERPAPAAACAPRARVLPPGVTFRPLWCREPRGLGWGSPWRPRLSHDPALSTSGPAPGRRGTAEGTGGRRPALRSLGLSGEGPPCPTSPLLEASDLTLCSLARSFPTRFLTSAGLCKYSLNNNRYGCLGPGQVLRAIWSWERTELDSDTDTHTHHGVRTGPEKGQDPARHPRGGDINAGASTHG